VRVATEPYEVFTMTVKTAGTVTTHGGTAGTLRSTKATVEAIRAMAAEHYVKMTHYLDDEEVGTVKYVSIIPPSPERIFTSRRESLFTITGLYAPMS